MKVLEKRSRKLKATRWLCLFGLLATASQSFTCTPQYLHDSQFDHHFKNAVKTFAADVDWRSMKAMCWQESRFKPLAVSPVGAMGFCQVMPNTWKFITKKARMNGAKITDTRANIYAGVAYFSWIWNQWSAKRSQWQKTEVSLASYNAGLGHILKAQKLCGNAPYWEDIKLCMSRVTGPHNSKETIDYVERITDWRSAIIDCQNNVDQSSIDFDVSELVLKYYTFYNRLESWLYQSRT